MQDTLHVVQVGSSGTSYKFWVSLAALVVSTITLVSVFVQLRYMIRQLRLETLSKIVSANRDLITLGFEDPDLFTTLNPSDRVSLRNESDIKRERYLQLMLNHVELIWQSKELGMLTEWQWSGLEEDISHTFEVDYMLQHWENVKTFYPVRFREYIDEVIKESEAT